MNKIELLPYTQQYYPDYVRVYQPYWLDQGRINGDAAYRQVMSASGFLVGDPNPVDADLMNESPFHRVAMVEGGVVGVIRMDRLDTDSHIAGMRWQPSVSVQVRTAFEAGDGMELGVILVQHDLVGQGVGRRMWAAVEDWSQEQQVRHIFSWVPSNPANLPSQAFHLRMGFRKVAHFSADKMWGIEAYESDLLVKPMIGGYDKKL